MLSKKGQTGKKIGNGTLRASAYLENFHFIVCFVKKKAPQALRACGAKRRKKQKKRSFLNIKAAIGCGIAWVHVLLPIFRPDTRKVVGKVLGKYSGSTREVLGKYSASTREVLGKALAKYRRRYWKGYWPSTGEVPARYWRRTGEVLAKYWPLVKAVAPAGAGVTGAV